jgi:FlaA1/EpsC-like NDP-sugar epimerase
VLLDGLLGAVAYSLAMVLRFADEGAVPATYALRAAGWAVPAALVHVGAGEVMSRLRRPRSPLAGRPVLPFAVAGSVGLLIVLTLNLLVLPSAWRLPLSVAIFGPLLASAASAALRLAASRPFVVDELLPRRVIQLDLQSCAATLANKRVLITGAAGSIGSELARQVFALQPETLIVVDVNETGLYELEAELAAPRLRTCIADVTDAPRLQRLFEQERPHVVFHAAAYKHVPLLETNPDQGFVTNILGTLVVCEVAAALEVERVVVISTDKAVNPSSFMGLTKRVAELIVTAVGQQAGLGSTALSAVRFGNVLGSRGSVVPTLLRQIEAGGPVTITDRDAQRYFMTISEAAGLVVLTAAIGRPGGVFVLDMGEALRIEDLAERLVRLRGLRPGRDVLFEYVGLRPGEKLREELCGAGEQLVATEHPAVRRVESAWAVNGPALLAGVRSLDERRRTGRLELGAYPVALRGLIDAALQDQVHVSELVP